MEIKIPPLPKNTDKLFTSEEDWWNNACLNYLPDGWAIYTAGYRKASDIIVDWVGSEKHFQDALVFPVIFLYRQYLELTIKDLIRQGHKLLDIKQRFPKTHKIDELWKICERLLRKISPGDSEKELRQIGRLIGEFCKVDPTSMAFRYPEDKNGNPSLPGIRHINIRNVRDVIDKISVILEGAGEMIYQHLSYKADMLDSL